MDRSSRQKINKETLDLNYVRPHRLNIYRTFSPIAAEYTFFSKAHEISFQKDHIGRHKISLNKFMKIEITSSIFFDHNGMKL